MGTAPPPPIPTPADPRFGGYTLVDRLAVGGMAEVYRALEPRPVGEPRLVVIKKMLPTVAAQPGARDMFAAEANLSAVIRHENVVDVMKYGEEAGTPFLAMEYVRGTDLWRLMRHLTRLGRSLEPALALYMIRKVLTGLHAVHEARDPDGKPLGVVHRDVSPSNVLLSVHGDVKLGDFGIAYATMRERMPNGPLSDRAKGKLGYLAPEQVVGEKCDRRADVFSTAVIAAELLLGRPLFAGGSELAVLLAIRDAQIHPLVELAPSLPAGLVDILAEALARDREQRTGSASELWALLGPFCPAPDADYRTQLGVLVSDAMAWTDDLPEEITPLGDVPSEFSSDNRTPPQDRGSRPSRTPVPSPFDARDAGPITAEIPTLTYRVRTADGVVRGPWPYSQLVEELATGALGPNDEVADDDNPFRPIGENPNLLRHLPPSTQGFSQRPPDGGTPEPDEVVPLDNGGIVGALAWSTLRKDTGLWLCERGGVRKEVYVSGGVPEFVSSNLAGELLGEYLVTQQVISRGELDMALAVMPRFEGRLGDTLAALGLVEPVHLFQHIAGQVREKLLDLFLWTGGQAAFYRGVPPPTGGFPLGLDPWNIVEEGIHRRFGQGLEDERFQGRDGTSIVQVENTPISAPHELPPDARVIFAAAETPRILADLSTCFVDAGHRRDARARRALVLLFHLGVVQWS